MLFHIHTYGCQMNERDSEAAAALMMRHGHSQAQGEREADVVIVNTCSVRDKAEDKALGKLRLLVVDKRDHAGRIVGVMGCMAQRLGADLFARVPGVDFAIGTHRLGHLPALVERVAGGETEVLDVAQVDGPEEAVADHLQGAVSAFVNILFGCNRGCSYCVVPSVRGREWSRPAAEVVREVEGLVTAGVKEVTLLGQSVMSYGRANEVWAADSSSRLGFTEPLPRLLEAVSGVQGIRRIRFTSGHPSGCTAELARAMKELPPVCEHLHLPLQSGSDRILAEMGRGYGTNDYAAAVARLRNAVPGVGLTTDIIVGFPGETNEEFEQTRAFMDAIDFDNAFIFKYSPRPGTRAAAMRDDVPTAEKMRRNKVLLADQDRRCTASNNRLVDSVQEVLVEGESLRNASRWAGRTRTNKIVVFAPVPGIKAGDVVSVRVERAMPQTLYGTVV